MKYYGQMLENYFCFRGRTSLGAFWIAILFNFIITVVISIVCNFLHIWFIPSIYGLIVFFPLLGMQVRRLHDIGKAGWWIFIVLVPIIGWIWLIVLFASQGQPYQNQYGDVPVDGQFIN